MTVPFSERPLPDAEVRRLVGLAQRAYMQHGRGVVTWIEGVDGERYLIPADLARAPLSDQQREQLAALLAQYDPAWEVLLQRVNRDGQSLSLMIFRLRTAPPRGGVLSA